MAKDDRKWMTEEEAYRIQEEADAHTSSLYIEPIKIEKVKSPEKEEE